MSATVKDRKTAMGHSVVSCDRQRPADFGFARSDRDMAVQYVANDQERKSSRHPSICVKLQRRFARHDHPDSCSLARLGIQIDPTA